MLETETKALRKPTADGLLMGVVCFILFLIFWKMLSLCFPGWTVTLYMAQAVLEHTETHLPLPPMPISDYCCFLRQTQ